MRITQKLVVLLVVVLVIISSSLFAAKVEATYEEELDTTIYSSTHFGIQSARYPVALHVGKMTIYTRGNGNIPDLFSIRINRSGNFGGGSEYWLTSSKTINWQDRFGAQLVAKTTFDNRTIVRTINWGTGEDFLMGEADFDGGHYPITIDFYLGIRNIHNATQAQGAVFQFENKSSPNLGKFKIAYRNNLNSNSYHDIPFIQGNISLPFFITDYNNGSQNFFNGKSFDDTVYVALDIEQASFESSIDLVNASGQAKSKVGQARLTLSGYNSPSTKGVSLTFTDGNGSTDNDFLLRHEEIPSFIPFSLYLAGEKVNNGVPITWGNLAYGNTNLKNLEVGGINHKNAISKMGGSYSDTITVTIVPLDSNLVGR